MEIRRFRGLVACLVLSSLVPAQDTPGQQEPKEESPPKVGPSLLNPPSPEDAVTSATIEQIMNQAVKNIARRYNLNEAQTIETQKLMRREVMRFLQEHEEQIWPAIRDLLTVQGGVLGNPQGGGDEPSAREAIARLAKVAKPLTQAAKEAIFEANDEWRLYLTAEQKRIHDFDMAEMRETFKEIDANMEQLSKGALPEGGLFPPPKPIVGGPPKPRKPAEGLPKPELFEINIFDNFVENFIREYGLDPAQADAARSILNETKSKADAFKQTKEQELLKVAMEKKVAIEARDRERKEKAEQAKKELLKPIDVMFVEFEDRLKGLLTSAQLQKYNAKHAAHATAEERLRADSSQAAAKPAAVRQVPPRPPVPAAAQGTSPLASPSTNVSPPAPASSQGGGEAAGGSHAAPGGSGAQPLERPSTSKATGPSESAGAKEKAGALGKGETKGEAKPSSAPQPPAGSPQDKPPRP